MPSALLWASLAETLFWILQIRQGCGPAGFAFSREGAFRETASAAVGLRPNRSRQIRLLHNRPMVFLAFWRQYGTMDSEEDTGGVFMGTLSYPELEATIRLLLKKYHAEYALLFGSYARGEATPNSDIDLVVVGGPGFRARDIFALGEELRQLTRKDADVFELRELNTGTPFYNTVMQEGVRIA
jgi:predicted nucleotidyltransferase